MRRVHRPEDLAGRRWAALIEGLDLPAPLTIDGVGTSLGRHCRRPVHVMPSAMGPGGPSGTWLRSADADFLFVEQETSPFHQIHIACCLAGHVLLDEILDGRIDGQLVPNVSPSATRKVTGAGVTRPGSPGRAEKFAVQVMRHAGLSPAERCARSSLRRLRPLHAALVAAVPAVAMSNAGRDLLSDPSVRLHRMVIQIRDAALALKPYAGSERTAGAPAQSRSGEHAKGLAAAVEAARLVSVRGAGPADNNQNHEWRHACSVPSTNLWMETAQLIEASEAFVRSALGRTQKPPLHGAACAETTPLKNERGESP